jgi:hypothetical protein
MNRDEKLMNKRRKFVTLAFTNPIRASNILRTNARKLDQAKTIVEKVRILEEILYISERTIYNDVNAHEDNI